MKKAFFNNSGDLILLVESSGVITPPDGTEYSFEVDENVTANDIYLDPVDSLVKVRGLMGLTVNQNTLSNIPAGSLVVVEGEAYSVDDGVMEFETNVTHTIKVQIINPKFYPANLEIEITP